MIISSLSGGRTSAYMAKKLIDKYGRQNVKFVFANTSFEHEETYKFIRECELEWELDLTYLEAVVHKGRKACTHKVVSYGDLKKDGSVFENVVSKYGLPNKVYTHCTRELKENPIKSWRKEKGYMSYPYAIGIRVDEIDRMSPSAEKNNIIYPLVSEFPSTKEDVLIFWSDQKFNLNLLEHYGNCITCFKKSAKKLMTVAKHNPQYFNFFDRLEKKYMNLKGESRHMLTSARFKKWIGDDRLTILGLVGLAQHIDFDEFYDEYYEDTPNGCSESCEPFSD